VPCQRERWKRDYKYYEGQNNQNGWLMFREPQDGDEEAEPTANLLKKHCDKKE
jgi:hypothetical protein